MYLAHKAVSSLLAMATLALFTHPSAAQTREDRALVVGVIKGKSFDQRLTKSLSDHLERSGHVSVIPSSLSTTERLCSDQDCLDGLARREDAQLLVSAIIQQNEPGSYFISLGLFDATRQAPFQESISCEQCSPTDLLTKLSDATDRLIIKAKASRGDKPTAPAAPTPVLTSRAIPTIPLEENKRSDAEPAPRMTPKDPQDPQDPPMLALPQPASTEWTRNRKILIGVLSGTTAVALGLGIGLHIKNGSTTERLCSRVSNSKDYCELNTSAFFGTAYGVAAASAVGLGFTLFWPSKKQTEQPASSVLTVAPNSSQHTLRAEVR